MCAFRGRQLPHIGPACTFREADFFDQHECNVLAYSEVTAESMKRAARAMNGALCIDHTACTNNKNWLAALPVVKDSADKNVTIKVYPRIVTTGCCNG